MWYFAYGSNLNLAAVSQWCRDHGHRAPAMKSARPAELDNYRLCFPIYSEYWGGGIADVAYDPGKSVAGALFDLSEEDMRVLDLKVERRLDAAGNEVGVYKRTNVRVRPSHQAEALEAVTYQGTNAEKLHIPPTRHYMELLVRGAYGLGLSMMWISYLQSFSTQPGRKPRPPKSAKP